MNQLRLAGYLFLVGALLALASCGADKVPPLGETPPAALPDPTGAAQEPAATASTVPIHGTQNSRSNGAEDDTQPDAVNVLARSLAGIEADAVVGVPSTVDELVVAAESVLTQGCSSSELQTLAEGRADAVVTSYGETVDGVLVERMDTLLVLLAQFWFACAEQQAPPTTGVNAGVTELQQRLTELTR